MKTTSKTKWKYFEITLISFEITGIHMYNMQKSVEKQMNGFESEDP